MKDLEGITVVALEQAVAAPYASCRLADAGALLARWRRHRAQLASDTSAGSLGLASVDGCFGCSQCRVGSPGDLVGVPSVSYTHLTLPTKA